MPADVDCMVLPLLMHCVMYSRSKLSEAEIRVGELESELAKAREQITYLGKEWQYAKTKIKEREHELSFRQQEVTAVFSSTAHCKVDAQPSRC